MKDFKTFKEELQAMLRNMEKEHAAKCEKIEKYMDDYFRERAKSEPNAFLPDPVAVQVTLLLSEAEDKIREAQTYIYQVN